ncbi:helix-turn-helix domain-containing protein [Halomonas sp. PR-M31]|uniref:helix-turn-helix domain-containing protein n=1 Tax=Halomonas sp. PR-M31 TaxID=1471202 RepID=UPI0006517227|nr:helix-turn-helix domain-containing protein [Halomonas sp. PR-M31]
MSKYDWEAIERDYRAGQLSIRHLAANHGVPESTVRTRARNLGWSRDLTRQVQAATRAKLAQGSRSKTAQDDARIIDDASNDAASIIEIHRKAIGQWRDLAVRLADHLRTLDISNEEHDRFARSLNTGIDALMKAVKGERQAYSLDDDRGESPKDAIAALSDEELDARIRELSVSLGYM